ncbi:MAG: hypothetical protein R3236_09845, partial [Phycisphaeraceae bacterium]|nr:hypothetical protein [Phycisphaeraceae bacterium]
MSDGPAPESDSPAPQGPVAVTLGCGHQASVAPELFGGSVQCPTCGQVQPLPRSAETAAIASQRVELEIRAGSGAGGSVLPSRPKPKQIDRQPVAWPWFAVLPFVAVVSVGLTMMAREIGEPWHPAGIMAATCAIFFLTQLGL